MASEVGVVNSALRKIGQNTIMSLTEGTDNANVAADLYAEHRDDMLSSHPWNFATRRVKLARSSSSPPYRFEYQYPIPANYLRTVEVHANEGGYGVVTYAIEEDEGDGTVIRSDAEEIWLTYVSQVTDPNKMPPYFRKALSLSLAGDMAIPIAQSNSLADRFTTLAKQAISKAKSIDSMEDYPEAWPAGSWLSSRFSNNDDSWT